MSKDQDKFISEEDYSLEDILAEFSTTPPKEQAGPVFIAQPEDPDPELPWPEAHRRPHQIVTFPSTRSSGPETGCDPAGADEEEDLPSFHTQEELDPTGEEPSSPIEHLKRKADAFADRMFEDEGVEVSEHTVRAETLIPGVDEEEAAEKPPRLRERKPRKQAEPPPDLPPDQLYRTYSKGLGSLRLRWLLVCVLCLLQSYLLLWEPLSLPVPYQIAASYPFRVYLTAGLFLIAAILGADVWWDGLVRLIKGQAGMDSLLAFAILSITADALTLMFDLLPGRDGQLPYCGVVCFTIAFALRGRYLKQLGLRTSCKVAASAHEPYVVTLDPARWNGKPSYSKHADPINGFGRQIQCDDGAQRIFRVVCPVILIACVVLSLLSSVGQGRPEYLLWCLSAAFTASASFGGMLTYSKPFHALSKRLSLCGAALAGWDGIQDFSSHVLITDPDLFPPGTVTVNGIKVFGDFPLEKVTAICATLIRDAGSGLDKIFRDLLRAQGGNYRNASDFVCYEAGGMSAVIRDQQVLVGTAAFMSLMEIRLPQGLNVKNAVFCAIDGELAGIFALNYSLHSSIPAALDALIRNKISPVLVTRDHNIIPSMLRQRFKLPVERMEYPGMERRMELSDPALEHAPIITAVLCREGLYPLSEAVVGGQRLRRATRLSTILTCIGSALGVLLSYYLTVHLAFLSLSPASLLIYLLMWLVPTHLISGWVDKY